MHAFLPCQPSLFSFCNFLNLVGAQQLTRHKHLITSNFLVLQQCYFSQSNDFLVHAFYNATDAIATISYFCKMCSNNYYSKLHTICSIAEATWMKMLRPNSFVNGPEDVMRSRTSPSVAHSIMRYVRGNVSITSNKRITLG